MKILSKETRAAGRLAEWLRALLLTSMVATSGAALAGVAPRAATPAPESRPVVAVRALMSHCLPRIAAAEPIGQPGLTALPDAMARRLLGARPGRVWRDADGVLIATYADAPTCRVIAPDIEPAVMTDLVLRVFAGSGAPFRRERFRVDPEGGFAAVFTAPGRRGRVVLRMSTARSVSGRYFAVLGVELAPATPAQQRPGSAGR